MTEHARVEWKKRRHTNSNLELAFSIDTLTNTLTKPSKISNESVKRVCTFGATLRMKLTQRTKQLSLKISRTLKTLKKAKRCTNSFRS